MTIDSQIKDVLRISGVRLDESILDAKSVGDELMNIILKNPTRRELRDNDMNICRGAMGRSGNFYFISLSQLAHCDLFDTLEQMGINDAPYNTFKYSNKTNTFYYYDPDNDLDFNLIKKELEASPYFKNFAGCHFDTFTDPDYDPDLYESVQLSEREDLTKFNRIAGFYHYDTKQFELFPRTSEDISVEDDEVNDYIHNVHSKDEFTEFNIVRFGIEDIPGEGVVCYIEGDTKRNVEKCYYAILEKYAEECDIIKYELEYYVGNNPKFIYLDRRGNQIMESLNESVKDLNKDFCDTKIITSAYEMKQYINFHIPLRIVYDNVNDWYLVNDANKAIHSAILDDAISAGLYNEEGVRCGNDLMYSERHVQFPLFNTSESFSEEYAMDGYAFAYDYGNFVIYDRYGELVNTPLYKVLGQPKETIRIDGYDENEELDESVNKGIDFVAYHGSHQPDMIPAKNRALYLTDDKELAEQFAKGEVYGDGLYDGEVATVFTFKGHFNKPYYMTHEEYDNEGQDDELDYQKWVNMGVDGIVLLPDEETSATYYIVIDLSTIKLIDKKVFEDEAILDESIFWKGEKINNYEQGYYPYGENNTYDKEDEMIVWKNPSAEWMKHQIDAGNYFRFTYITTTDTLFVWYGENGFHRDTMDITGIDGDVIGTMTRNNIDYWPDDDDSPALGDKLFREKREKFLKTIYPNGYDIGVQY